MSKAGMTNGLLMRVIKSRPSQFDTSAAALITLKHEGITDEVIASMMDATSNHGAQPTTASSESPTPRSKEDLFTSVDDKYERYEGASAASFEVPSSWQKKRQKYVWVFSPINDTIPTSSGGEFTKHMIIFGHFPGADSPGMTTPIFSRLIQREFPHVSITKPWDYVTIPAFAGASPEVMATEYVNDELPGHTEVGILAIERVGVSYYWWMMGCPQEERKKTFPIYIHVLESIRRRDK